MQLKGKNPNSWDLYLITAQYLVGDFNLEIIVYSD